VPLAGTIGGGLILAGTNPPRSCRRGGRGWHCWVLVAAVFSGAANLAVAASLSVVLSDDSEPYQEAYESIRARLEGQGHHVSRVYSDRLDSRVLDDERLVVAVGVHAAESLIPLASRPPVLAILVPRDWYLKTGRPALTEGGRQTASAIYIDQPFERQAQLIHQAFPDIKRVGLILGVKQAALLDEVETAMRGQGLTLIRETISTQRALISTLEKVLSSSDVLLALPDPEAFNRTTAQSIFLTSYRYRDPVLGYSRSLTRAGALLSLHSSPAQVGRQAAEWIASALQDSPVRLPAASHPAYFSVSVNDQVARSLGWVLPAEDELVRKLGGEP